MKVRYETRQTGMFCSLGLHDQAGGPGWQTVLGYAETLASACVVKNRTFVAHGVHVPEQTLCSPWSIVHGLHASS